ncbi:hypothetical protein HZ994_09570 [Akkermansiaceae bacterium]|nr:hypothetical protein HZ994_09570 [Akkermansiaceae bacterium]
MKESATQTSPKIRQLPRGRHLRLVVLLSPISSAFRDIGEVVIMIATLFAMLPLFALTAKNWDETMGDWHLRTFGKTLRERFLHNVIGMAAPGDAPKIDQTASSASPSPTCSTSFDSGESWITRNLLKLGNNLGGAWEALNEDPPFLWRAKRLLLMAGGCLQNLLPEDQPVGHLKAFADAVRDDLKLEYHSPQECPKCRCSTSNHSYPRHPMNNMRLQLTPVRKHGEQVPTATQEVQPSAQSNRLAEQEVVGGLPFSSSNV